MFPPLASLTALRRRAFASTSPPPVRVATVISLIIFVKILPRLASSAPFLCLIVCHLECPDIRNERISRAEIPLKRGRIVAPATKLELRPPPRRSPYREQKLPPT